MTDEVTIIPDRKLIMRAAADSAAAAFDQLHDRTAELEAKLREALAGLEGRNARIEVLERAINEDREQFKLELLQRDNIIESYRTIRDEALHERDQLRIVFHSLRTQLDALELPLRGPSRAQEVIGEGYTNGPVEAGHA